MLIFNNLSVFASPHLRSNGGGGGKLIRRITELGTGGKRRVTFSNGIWNYYCQQRGLMGNFEEGTNRFLLSLSDSLFDFLSLYLKGSVVYGTKLRKGSFTYTEQRSKRAFESEDYNVSVIARLPSLP